MKNIRKYGFILTAFLFSIIFLTFSCNNISEVADTSEDSTNSNDCIVKLSISNENSRAVNSQVYSLEKDFAFSLHGELDANTPQIDEEWESYEKMNKASFVMRAGAWTFTMKAFLKTTESDGKVTISKEPMLYSTLSNKEITKGTNKLDFTMKICEEGTGSFSMDLTFNKGVTTKVEASLCKLDENGVTVVTEDELGEQYNPESCGTITQVWSGDQLNAGVVTYKIDNIRRGSYRLRFELTEVKGESATVNYFNQLARVVPGTSNSVSYNISDTSDTSRKIKRYYAVYYEDGVPDEEIIVPKDEKLYEVSEQIRIDFSVGDRKGWKFKGWEKNDGQIISPSKTDIYISVSKNFLTETEIRLVAKWEPLGDTAYTVRHWQQKLNADCTDVSGTDKTIIEGDTIDKTTCKDYKLVAYPTSTGTTGDSTAAQANIYSGFETGYTAGSTTVVQQKIAADGSTIVDIFYDRDSYSVSYDDGVEKENISVPAGIEKVYFEAKVTVAFEVGENPILRTGYTFNGWRQSDTTTTHHGSGTDEPVTFKMPASDVTLTAQWVPNDRTAYWVRHWKQKLNKAETNISGTSMEITEGETPANATCTDYKRSAIEVLYGKTDAQIIDDEDEEIKISKEYIGFGAGHTAGYSTVVTYKTIAANGSTIVDIFYDRIKYTVSYDDGVDGETIGVPKDSYWYYESKATVDFTVGSRTGYTFSIWQSPDTVNLENDGGAVTFKMPASDVKLIAQWTPNTGTKYTVRHWQQKLNSSDTVVSGTDNAISEGETIDKATCKDYKLVDYPTSTGTTNSETTAQANSYSGFKAQAFAQKTIAANGSTIVDIFYDRTEYKLQYDGNVSGATIIVPDDTPWYYEAKASVDFDNADETPMSQVGLRPGYTFLGWSEDKDATAATYTATGTNTFTMKAGDITLYAVWRANTAGISVNWVNQTADMPLFTYEIGGEGNTTITFTAPADYSSCTWYLSSQTSVASGNTYEWNTATIANGTYYVTLVATDSAGKKWSSTMKVEVNK